MNVEIEISERLNDWWIDADGKEQPKYHAQIKGEPGMWACGRSPTAAIGDLVNSHPKIFGINVTYLGKQAR